MWLFPAVLGALIIRKPGAALFCELVAAMVSALMGSEFGLTVLASGLAQGLGAELVFAAFRYRKFNLPVALLAGAGAGLFGSVNDTFIFRWFPEYTTGMLFAYIAFMTISGILIAGLLSFLATRALAKTGALGALASRKAATDAILSGTAAIMTSPSLLHREADAPGTERQLAAAVAVSARDWGWRHADRAQPALWGLDLEIRAGERVLLAGPSGAGKSTLLYALAGVLNEDDEAYSSGELLLDGTPAAQGRGLVGLMQQDPETQVVQARVGDDVAFGAENLSVPPEQIAQRIIDALDAVGLDVPLEHPTAALSGGQKQRLALAGILAMGPGLVLLDEPTANLDPAGVLEVRDAVIRALDATGATLLIVEHRLEAWAPHMDRVIVLEPGGGIAHDGTPRELFGPGKVREDLISAGVWVPGYTPAIEARVAPAESGTLLLEAGSLAVTRRRGGVPAAGGRQQDRDRSGGGRRRRRRGAVTCASNAGGGSSRP